MATTVDLSKHKSSCNSLDFKNIDLKFGVVVAESHQQHTLKSLTKFDQNVFNPIFCHNSAVGDVQDLL